MEQFDFFSQDTQSTQDEIISSNCDVIAQPKTTQVADTPPTKTPKTSLDHDEDTNVLLYATNNARNIWSAFKHRRDCLMQISRFCSFKDYGIRPMSQITAKMLYDYRDYLQSTGIKNGTINRHMSAVSAALRFAVESRVIADYPRCRSLKELGGRPRSFTDAEVEAICNYFTGTGDSWMADMVTLSCKTGMRCGEIVMINHPKVVIREDFKEMYLPPEVTKTSKGRDVPLNKVASQAAQRLQKSINYSFTHSVFYDRWWNCKEALGYRDDKTFVFHVCRHTALTNMANKNVNSLIIGEIAGHSSIQTTKRYVHGDSKARASAVADI